MREDATKGRGRDRWMFAAAIISALFLFGMLVWANLRVDNSKVGRFGVGFPFRFFERPIGVFYDLERAPIPPGTIICLHEKRPTPSLYSLFTAPYASFWNILSPISLLLDLLITFSPLIGCFLYSRLLRQLRTSEAIR